MGEIAGAKPARATRSAQSIPSGLTKTLARALCERSGRNTRRRSPDIYDRDLRRIFSDAPRAPRRVRRVSVPAAQSRGDPADGRASGPASTSSRSTRCSGHDPPLPRASAARRVVRDRKLKIDFAILLTVQTMHSSHERQAPDRSMKKLRVLVLMHPDLRSARLPSRASRRRRAPPCKTEFDVVAASQAGPRGADARRAGRAAADPRGGRGVQARHRFQPARGVPRRRDLRPARGELPRAAARPVTRAATRAG